MVNEWIREYIQFSKILKYRVERNRAVTKNKKETVKSPEKLTSGRASLNRQARSAEVRYVL